MVGADLARGDQHLEHRRIGMNVDRKRRLCRREQHAWRRREAPTGDGSENCDHEDAFNQDRTEQWMGVVGIGGQRRRHQKSVQRGKAEQDDDQRQLDQQDDPVTGVDQRADILQLNDRQREAGQRHQAYDRHRSGARRRAPPAADRRIAGAPSRPAARARRPSRRRRHRGRTPTAATAIAATPSQRGRSRPAKDRRPPSRTS